MADEGWTTVSGRGGAGAQQQQYQPAAAGSASAGAASSNLFGALKVDPDARVKMPKPIDKKTKEKSKEKAKKKREARRLAKAQQLLDRNAKPGFLGNLSSSQQSALQELKKSVAHLNFPGCLDGAPDGLTDQHALRFLRARDFNVKKAQQMLEAAVQWRKEFQPFRFTLADIRIQLDRGCAFCTGHDKLGRPAMFSRSALHDPAVGEVAVHATLYFMEQNAQSLRPPLDSYAIVFDLTGYGNKNSDLAWTRSMIGYLQNYYPERMGLCLICNAPFAFRMLWAAVKGLMTSRTTEKIVFLAGDYMEKILMYFDRDQLPPFLGGTNTFDPQQWVLSQLGPSQDPRSVVPPDWIAAANSGMHAADEDFDEEEDD